MTGDPKVKGENFYRSAKKIKTLNVLKEGRAIRNKEGKVVKAASYQSKEVPKAVIEPNRKWFNNTRVIAQDALKAFRDAMEEKKNDPYTVLLKSNKLPMSLIRDGAPDTQDGPLKKHKAKMTIEAEPFALTYGPKAQRKKPKIDFTTIDDLAANTDNDLEAYHARMEQKKLLAGLAAPVAGEGEAAEEEQDFSVSTAKEAIFFKGQSKRIWNELYKVLDSSDVVLHVLDARDPEGTRCRHVEKYLATEAPHKHLVFVLNKIDLVPSKTAVSFHYISSTPSQPYRATAWSQSFCQGVIPQFNFCFAPLSGRGLLQHWEIDIHLLPSLVWSSDWGLRSAVLGGLTGYRTCL